MQNTIDSFVDALKALKPVTATSGARPRLRSNSHIHLPPNFAAFEKAAQAVQLAAGEQVSVLGASNYYDYAVYGEFAAECMRRGVFPLFGLEIIALIDDLKRDGIKLNDPGNPGKMYICGKGITRFQPMGDDAARLLSVIRANDAARMAAVIERMEAVFNAAGLTACLDADAVKRRVVARHHCPEDTVYLQERHITQAFQEVLFEKVPFDERASLLERAFGAPAKSRPDDAVAIQNEMRSQLMKNGKAAYVNETFVDFPHAYRLILALGGIPCYPVLADGASPVCLFEQPVDKLVQDLQGRQIPCAEFIPARNSAATLSCYARAMRESGLFVTAGTEHNTLDLIPIEPMCIGGEPIPDDIQELFWEGACVVAGHQYETFLGRDGFVGADGALNSSYAGPDQRIAAFRTIGESVIHAYISVR